MKNLLFLCFFFTIFMLKAQEKYFLLPTNSNTETTYQDAIKSTNFLVIDIETGKVSGQFFGKAYLAEYDIVGTSSGFVKGFNYTIELGYLQRDVANNATFNQLTSQLAGSTKFYFYPDALASPNWHFLEISGYPNSEKVRLIMKH